MVARLQLGVGYSAGPVQCPCRPRESWRRDADAVKNNSREYPQVWARPTPPVSKRAQTRTRKGSDTSTAIQMRQRKGRDRCCSNFGPFPPTHPKMPKKGGHRVSARLRVRPVPPPPPSPAVFAPQKKTRTHVDSEALFAASAEHIPRSFVVKKGKVPARARPAPYVPVLPVFPRKCDTAAWIVPRGARWLSGDSACRAIVWLLGCWPAILAAVRFPMLRFCGPNHSISRACNS